VARYFIIATILVVGTLVAATAYREFGVRISVGAGKGTIAPRPAPPLPGSSRAPVGLRGDAPWALSALPDCMIQIQEWKGTLAYVRAHLPHDARLIVSPATLRYGDCGIALTDSQAIVTRGQDRLRIPPISQLYALAGNGLALVRAPRCTRSNCAAVLRVYATPEPRTIP
jgi:hypothetical protein